MEFFLSVVDEVFVLMCYFIENVFRYDIRRVFGFIRFNDELFFGFFFLGKRRVFVI